MDYRKVQLFLAAARHGNLTEAAASMEISQPALSKSIKALEKSLGVRLLERGRFGVSLTPFGQALMEHGRVIEAEMRNALGEIQSMRGAQRGHVMMGCGPTEATRLLPKALKVLADQNPDVHVTVLYGLNEALMPWVKQGEVDFALSSVPARAVDMELVHDYLFTESATVVARADHPLAKHKVVHPGMLVKFPWILPRQHELERLAFDDYFASHDLEPPVAQVETTSTVLMKSMVMHSDALTFIPKELIYWEVQAGQLKALEATGNQWERRVGMTRRRKGTLSPASKLLIQAVKSVAQAF
ncbi:LysR family transcriptional regulator [Limnohabitans sp.]|uniref:LysR family transcriptional regulator n=1 Tax=Limnohabitans sp. TaxID=1907725 RepID=UPI0038B741BF